MKPVAVVFDLFGTLLDIGSLRSAAAAFTDDPAALVATWREKQLGYAFASTLMERYRNFDELTERALRFAAARHAVPLQERDVAALAAAWRAVEPYEDARPALAELRRLGLRCGILTNGTPETSRAALEHAGLADAIDVLLSVESVAEYKPSPRVYALVTDHYGASADRFVFVTANGWDATGAAEFGLRVVWCNRTGAPAETFGAAVTATVRDLRGLVGELAREMPLHEVNSGRSESG
jgi:2-haloacid dehalogenase